MDNSTVLLFAYVLVCAKCITPEANTITANVKNFGCKLKSCMARGFFNLACIWIVLMLQQPYYCYDDFFSYELKEKVPY